MWLKVLERARSLRPGYGYLDMAEMYYINDNLEAIKSSLYMYSNGFNTQNESSKNAREDMMNDLVKGWMVR